MLRNVKLTQLLPCKPDIEPYECSMKQVPRCMHPDLTAKLEAEVDKIITTSFRREVQYPIWLANIVRSKNK